MDYNYKDKVVFITGASRGLGRYLCTYFAEKGAKIAATARDESKLAELAAEIENKGGGIFTYAGSVSDYDAMKEAASQTVEKWGTIDLLINNAGVGFAKPMEDQSKEEIDATIDTNIKGLIYVTQHVVKYMKEANKGHIFNISSTVGIRGARSSVYSATKFAVNGFSEGISKKLLMENNIHVVNLNPGGIDTTWWDRTTYATGKDNLIQPHDMARFIDFILSNPENIFFKQALFFPTREMKYW